MSRTGFFHSSWPRSLVVAAWLAGLAAPTPLSAAEPPQPPALTAAQKERLKERDRLEREVFRLDGQGKRVEAIAAAEKLLAIEREVLGNFHSDVAGSLIFLAEAHESGEDFAAARKARAEVLEIVTKLRGAGHWRVTDARLALEHVERLAKMDAAQRRRLAELEQLRRRVNALGRQGKYSEAVELCLQVAEGYRRALGEKHPKYTVCLNDLAVYYDYKGDYAKAEALYRQAVEGYRQVLGEKHPEYVTCLSNLAQLFYNQGNYDKAELLYRQAVEGYRQALGEGHAKYASALSNLALLYKSKGDYAKAEPLYHRAVAIKKAALGEQHSEYAAVLNNLAGLYEAVGDYARAEPLYRRALEINKTALGEKHPAYALSLNNLANLYLTTEDYAKAELLFRQALELKKAAQGERHPEYADVLNNLANFYLTTGDYAKAEPLFRQAVEITKGLGERHPDYGQYLNNLAELYSRQGDYAKAEPLFRQALEIIRRAAGEKHPNYAYGLNNLAMLHNSMGNPARAEPLYRRALDISRDHFEATAATQSERQQLALLRALRYMLDTYLSLPGGTVDAAVAYRHVLAWKGAVFLRQRRTLLQRRHPELAHDFAALDRVASRLAVLALATPAEQGERDKQIAALTDEKERLEANLAGRSAAFRKELELTRLEPEKLRAILPDGAVLIDLLEYTHFSRPQRGKGKLQRERRLVAFAVRRDALARVDLGPAEAVTKALDGWRLALQRRVRTEGDAKLGVEARRLAWDKLGQHTRGAKVVLVSPDGPLARVPLAALPGARPDTYLLEEVAVATVPVPQLLPELLAPRAEADRGEPSLLLVGAVNYDRAATAGTAIADSHTAPRGAVLKGWTRLDHTGDETDVVGGHFRRRFRNAAVTELRESDATEAAVRREAPRHRYLHLATHGYFAPPGLRSALATAPSGDSTAAELFGQRGVAGFHPGLLSGLVLAGVNRPANPDKDDGILTALEVQALDLGGVELAVLSACETGLGEEAGGEGLLGLQRAFQIAGARGVVASLWQVDDRATRELMPRFYENLWKRGLPKAEALREAQLWMLKEGASRGMVDVRVEKDRLAKDDGRLPPYYWAAFTLSGDWR